MRPTGMTIQGLGGVRAPSQLYERRGRQKLIAAVTALCFFPGILILVGPFVWFVQTNKALNAHWLSLGVRETSLV